MISVNQLDELKKLFAEDGITLTDAETLEIGHWLLARVQPVARPISLDKMPIFATIKNEVDAIRRMRPFVNLYEWRRKKCKE